MYQMFSIQFKTSADDKGLNKELRDTRLGHSKDRCKPIPIVSEYHLERVAFGNNLLSHNYQTVQ